MASTNLRKMRVTIRPRAILVRNVAEVSPIFSWGWRHFPGKTQSLSFHPSIPTPGLGRSRRLHNSYRPVASAAAAAPLATLSNNNLYAELFRLQAGGISVKNGAGL